MKKKMAAGLILILLFSMSTSLAAVNPFADVSPDDWAYGAVKQLAQAGLIDGYGDGTFRGNKPVTRYEMAQLIARAMYRSDKANAEEKAMLDRLSVEYKDELESLGVRLENVERNTAGVNGLKFSNWIQSENVYGNSGSPLHEYDWEYRFTVEKQVTDKVHTLYQIRTYTGLDSQRHNDQSQRGAVETRQAWISYQPAADTTMAFGKQVLWDGFLMDDFFRGATINTKLGKNSNLFAAAGWYDLSNAGNDTNGRVNAASISTKLGNFDVAGRWIEGEKDVMGNRGGNIVGGTLGYTFDNGLAIQANYAKNTRQDTNNTLQKYQIYKNINGTDVWLQYWKQGPNLNAPIENGDHMAWWGDMYINGAKGWRIIADRQIDKNFDISPWYGDYKTINTNVKAKKYGVDLTYSF
ncbi:Hypothetical protein LUCI_0363 [Lucifera butyrica]|uniref:SLH domain-containing protein n=1 Tax=Lucifera butyrica TaxID=1351585 RepID=A0A498QY96_9FIRM|nr:S-layer homology domain-containing protein [Lucifera butyrica]VBB05156.1 Hypothetical protein LUCI_0363 [Lucifera butyrica]